MKSIHHLIPIAALALAYAKGGWIGLLLSAVAMIAAGALIYISPLVRALWNPKNTKSSQPRNKS